LSEGVAELGYTKKMKPYLFCSACAGRAFFNRRLCLRSLVLIQELCRLLGDAAVVRLQEACDSKAPETVRALLGGVIPAVVEGGAVGLVAQVARDGEGVKSEVKEASRG
jgi:hypothetical protein